MCKDKNRSSFSKDMYLPAENIFKGIEEYNEILQSKDHIPVARASQSGRSVIHMMPFSHYHIQRTCKSVYITIQVK